MLQCSQAAIKTSLSNEHKKTQAAKPERNIEISDMQKATVLTYATYRGANETASALKATAAYGKPEKI